MKPVQIIASLLLLVFVLGCTSSPPPQAKGKKTKKKKPATSQLEKKSSAAKAPPPVTAEQRARMADEDRRLRMAYIQHDCDDYLLEVRGCRGLLRLRTERLNKEARGMAAANKYRGQYGAELNATLSNLSNRKNEVTSRKPGYKLPTLNKVTTALQAAVDAHEQCLTDIYIPLRAEIDSHQSSNDAPVDAINEGAAAGEAALARWDADLEAALAAWAAAEQQEIGALVDSERKR